MTTWHHRMLPYPLLAPWTDDYVDSAFSVDVPTAVLNNGRQIKIDLVFRLSSSTLKEMVDRNEAMYAVDVSCPRTFTSSTHEVSEKDELHLEAGNYDEEILLTPYIVSSSALNEFTSSEHASEWRDHRPGGFSVLSVGILAVGNTTRIILEDSGISSVIDLIANDAVADGTFDVQLSDERIKIHVPSAEKKKIEAVRVKRGGSVGFAALFPSLYLHAVAEGLRTLSEHEHTRWAFAMRNALNGLGYGSVDADLLRDDALKYAQELMEKPVGEFLTAALNSGEED